jgi:DNA polymerase-1
MNRLSTLMDNYQMGLADEGQQLSLFGGQEPPETSSASEVQTTIVDSPDALRDLVARLSVAQVVAFDTETTSTDQMSAELVGISLAVDGEHGYYIPIGHRPDLGKQLPVDIVIEALKEPLSDTHLAWVRLNAHMTSIDDLIGKGKKQISMADVPITQAADYAGDDAAILLQLLPQLRSEMEERHVMKLFEEIEMPLVAVLADMEMAGISLDTQFLADMSADLAVRLGEIETQVYQSVGEPFNLNSPQQLSRVLFERLQIPPPDRTRRTSSGYYSTAVGVLEALRGKHPVVDWVLEYRELSKLKSTYVDALPLQINSSTGRVHTSYNQTGSVTGRIASSDPNLQNIPIRTELGRRVRRGFITNPGFRLLAVDYSQVELRIVAHMAGDEAMLAAFRAGQDIHATTAAAIYNVTLENVTKEQRRHAKAVNFGLIYGMSPFGLTRTTDLTLAEAEEFVDAYFRKFPAIKGYLDDTRRQAADQGYVETLLARRRYFPGLKNQSNRNIRNREEREAINAPIQGTAADIMKIAMLLVPAALKEAGLSASMILQVHDELVLECPEVELNPTAALVQKVMENAYTLSIPLVTEARSGYNWGEMLPLGL